MRRLEVQRIRAKAFEILETRIDLDMEAAAYLQFGGMLAKAWHHLAGMRRVCPRAAYHAFHEAYHVLGDRPLRGGGITTLEIPKAELPPGKALTIAVRPLTSLGTSGKPLVAEFKV